MNLDKKIDNIINECITKYLVEANIDVSKDNVLKNNQKQLVDYFNKLISNGNEDILQTLESLGYTDITPQQMRINREKSFNGLNVSREVIDDVIGVAEILRQYTNGKSGINFQKLKNDYPSEYDQIIRLKNFIDLIGITRIYDDNANIPSNAYGIKWGKGGTMKDLDFNNISDVEANKYRGDKPYTLDEARYLRKKGIVDKYMNAKYGMKLKIPNITFSNGNKKLPDNTLIINFTSALNCPAWNECLVKHACYARAGEKKNPTAFTSNEKRSLFWLSTQFDNELLNLMMDFVRSYCFNYMKVADHLIKNNIIKSRSVNNLAIKISKMQLDDIFFTDEIKEVMKMYKRIDYIRLNENGDFVGQWLVDAWDDEAGKYQPYGINISAYTCRHLNYDGIKNIILNSSFINKNGNITRRFIALPEDIYNALDETYGGNNNMLDFNKDTVNPNPQPLYNVIENNLQPNGKIYYKCPCDRKNGNIKISCYQCNLCYNPKTTNEEMYVFVKAHGGAKEMLNGYDLIKHNIGVSKNFWKNYKGSPVTTESNNLSKGKLNIAYNSGINGVTNNAIHSMNEHFNMVNPPEENSIKWY